MFYLVKKNFKIWRPVVSKIRRPVIPSTVKLGLHILPVPELVIYFLLGSLKCLNLHFGHETVLPTRLPNDITISCYLINFK